MAIAETSTTAAELLEQAEKLDARAAQLRSGARELAEQAAGLRAEAKCMVREPIVFTDSRALHRRRILKALEQMGPMTSGQLADHLGISQQRAYKILLELEDSEVKRGGTGAGTIWGLAGDETLTTVHRSATATTLIRDAARRLGTFTFEEISEALPEVSDHSLRIRLPELERADILISERIGKAKLWEFVRPDGENAARPKRATPESEATANAPAMPRRGEAVAGSGRARRTGSSIVNELIREVRQHGVTVERRKHRLDYLLNGELIATSSTTPAASSLKETRSELRRAGVPVKA